MRTQVLQPFLVIRQEASFIIIEVHRGGDVHGIHRAQALLDATFAQGLFYLWRDVDKGTTPRDVEP